MGPARRTRLYVGYTFVGGAGCQQRLKGLGLNAGTNFSDLHSGLYQIQYIRKMMALSMMIITMQKSKSLSVII